MSDYIKEKISLEKTKLNQLVVVMLIAIFGIFWVDSGFVNFLSFVVVAIAGYFYYKTFKKAQDLISELGNRDKV